MVLCWIIPLWMGREGIEEGYCIGIDGISVQSQPVGLFEICRFLFLQDC